MDSLITAAARALAAGDPLGALKRVALRDDAPALALRGIAMAQLGDLVRAKALLRKAARAFSPREAVARARCVVAEAEIALASRDLGWPAKTLEAARATLDAHGDLVNAAHARYLEIRRLLLIGRLDEAERMLADLDPAPFPAASRAAHELMVAGIAMRRLRTKTAHAALARAKHAAHLAGIPALAAEVESASNELNTPAARLIESGEERLLLLGDVEALQASKALVVDACRHVVRDPRRERLELRVLPLQEPSLGHRRLGAAHPVRHPQREHGGDAARDLEEHRAGQEALHHAVQREARRVGEVGVEVEGLHQLGVERGPRGDELGVEPVAGAGPGVRRRRQDPIGDAVEAYNTST